MCNQTLINELSKEWLASKQQEAAANARRLQIEQQICELAKSDLPSEGTAKLGNVKVTTGFTRSWDAEKLTHIYRTKPAVFPFKVDWKEDRRLTSKLEVASPEVMAIFAEALTIKERKPSFSYIGE